jgi:exosome complex component RRP42
MGDDLKSIITGQIKRDALVSSLKNGKRFDDRGMFDLRNAEITTEVITTAEGSALVKMGKTQVLVGVKIGMATPFPDRPDEGVIITSAELLPVASPYFEPGPPGMESIELARVVDRGIRSAEVIDLKKLFVEEGKVLAVYIDIYTLDHGGNLIDAAALAAIAALKTAKMPKIEEGKIVYGEYTGKLDIPSSPVTTTFIKTGDYWLVDPLLDEEYAAETRITIATTEQHVCAVQKSFGSLSKKEFLDLIDMAFKKGNELRAQLNNI